MEINADDNSGVKHTSKNGNILLTCNCQINQECNVVVRIIKYNKLFKRHLKK